MGLGFQWQTVVPDTLGSETLKTKVYPRSATNPSGFKLKPLGAVGEDMMLWVRTAFITYPERVTLMVLLNKFFRRIHEMFLLSDVVFIIFDLNKCVTPAKAPERCKRRLDLESAAQRTGRDISPIVTSDMNTYFNPAMEMPDFARIIANRELLRFFFKYLVRSYLGSSMHTFTESQKLLVFGLGPVPHLIRANTNKPVTNSDGIKYAIESVKMPEMANCIGEGDIAIPFILKILVELIPGKAIAVRSIDGDTLPIVLMFENERIAAQAPFDSGTEIYLLMGDKTINATLYRKYVILEMLLRAPTLGNPLEHFIMALSLGGTDFFPNIDGMGGAFLFEKTIEFIKAREILSENQHKPLVEVRKMENETEHACASSPPHTYTIVDMCTPGVCASIIDATPQPGIVVVNSGPFEQLIKWLDTKKKRRTYDKSKFFQGFCDEKTRARSIQCYVRLITWTLNYWSCGYKHRGGYAMYHLNPLAHIVSRTAETCVSVWGFSIAPEASRDVFLSSVKDMTLDKWVGSIGTLNSENICRVMTEVVDTEKAVKVFCSDHYCCNVQLLESLKVSLI